MSPKRHLIDEDISHALYADDSEDGLDFDDDSLADPDFVPEFDAFEDEAPEVDIDVDSIIETLETIGESTSTEFTPSHESTAGSSQVESNPRMAAKPKPVNLNLRWKKKNLDLNAEQLMFTGNNNLAPDLLELDSPIQFFLYLFSNELMKKISEETNLYQVQKDPNRAFRIFEEDVRQFIGVAYLMSLIQLPKVTNHWSPILGTPLIQETMSLNKFEKIRQTLHFNDNSKDLPRTNPDHNRIYKRRPIVDSLNEAYNKVPMEEHLSVDEQMCSTKARNTLKRYNPNKPHKWGYKIFVLSGVSGFAYITEIETGKENTVLHGEPDLGASSNVVMRLARMVPRHQNFKLRRKSAVTLCKMGIKPSLSSRRSLESEIQAKNHKGPAQHVPPKAVRQDQIGPQWSDKKIRCKFPKYVG